jgi:hypothetical protein
VAVLIWIGAAGRDHTDRLNEFWQSRPIDPGHFIAVKYRTGLLVTLCVLFLPAGFAFAWVSHTWERQMLVNVVGIWAPASALLYSMSFVIAILMRPTTQAAILAFAAGLLLVFFPLVFPPLRWMNVMTPVFPNDLGERIIVLDPYRPELEPVLWIMLPWLKAAVRLDYLGFVAVSAAGAFASAQLAATAVRLGWRVRVDQKLICWTLGAVVLILFGLGSTQIGSNLEPQRVIPLPNARERSVVDIAEHEGRGVVLLVSRPGTRHEPVPMDVLIRTFDLNSSQQPFGPELPLGLRASYFSLPQLFFDPVRPHLFHVLISEPASPGDIIDQVELITIRADHPAQPAILHRLDLSGHVILGTGRRGAIRVGNTIYIRKTYDHRVGSLHLADGMWIIDLSDAESPKFRGEVAMGGLISARSAQGSTSFVVADLTSEPDLSPAHILEVRLEEGGQYGIAMREDGLLATVEIGGIRLRKLRDALTNTARFEQVGFRRASPLERLFTTTFSPHFTGQFLITSTVQHSAYLTAYDISRPELPRKVGHFSAAAQPFSATTITSDGRVLLAADRLYLFDPKAWR